MPAPTNTILTLCALAALFTAATSRADGPRVPRAPALAVYQQECAACHVAYPPGLLPAAAWQRLMDNLHQHFGTDASLDADSARQISAWLTRYAGPPARATGATPERITTSAWFVREHDEVPARVWKLPSVRSAANCAACHTQANQGDFNEHAIRIPRQ